MSSFTINQDTYEFEINLAKDYGTIWNKGHKLEGQMQDIETLNRIHEILETFGDNDVFIDCGAHMGLMSILIKKGKCFAVEPNPYAYNKLMNNVRLNKKSNVFALNEALYDKELNYTIKQELPSGMSKIVIDKKGEKKTYLGDYLFANIDNIKLIKIDCEDSTLNVLRGLTQTILKHKPILIIERTFGLKDEIDKLNYYGIKKVQENVECIPK